MKAVPYGVRELQARIGRALRIVERGGTILVTSRGRPVAMVVPPETRMPGESEEDWILRRLAAEGRLIPGNGKRIPRFRPPHIKGASDQAILERKARENLLGGSS